MSNATVAAGRERCGAKLRSGDGTCKLPAGHGTDHVGTGRCRRHGGKTQSHVVAARNTEAKRAVQTYGLPREIDPHAALLEELHRTAGHVAWLQQLVRDLNDTDLKQRSPGKGGTLFEAPAVWLELYDRERKHFADVAKTCIGVGIAERQVRLAEQQGLMIATVLRGVLSELGVADHPEAPAAVRRHLMLVAGES